MIAFVQVNSYNISVHVLKTHEFLNIHLELPMGTERCNGRTIGRLEVEISFKRSQSSILGLYQ